ncbi:C2H2 zinc finger domain protein, putative [Aspergillus oryzae 100-8]|uniref:C2H2 zinc finger domain protein, putative n=2 Tax=Aspergillus subgen. Circumdati TaxID=2720871 RepID=I8I6P4_ASPO3|nr:C2H2 zinc finger domain protein, putative [Aspergillus oryzae 3.042]KDE75149.1 C2H2 zinc finger domain protein, putative [Aspergillus oryzae 100-8]|eukprot:EIT72436.1 C2H2 zinc finger domain protein, putative [Aspergillus oryzae 3.042]
MNGSYHNEYYDLSFPGHCQLGHYATSEDGHLMPNPNMDPNSSSNYQSSATSPVSPSSCTSADIFPGGTALPEIDTDFQLYDYSTNDISPTLPLDAGHVPSTERLFSTIVPQAPHLHCPQSASSPDPLDQVKADLHRLQSTVQSAVRNVSHPQLFEMKSFVTDTYNCLENMIQEEIDGEIHSPHSTNSTTSTKDWYACQLCETHRRRTYSTKGAFRRHVSTEHAPRFRHSCPRCDWATPRRDKVWEHLRHRHSPLDGLKRNDIKRTKLRSPRACPLCDKSVQSWEAYFNCVAEHCRIQSGSSPGTSGVQSRRNSGDSGSGGDGFNGHFAPGNLFDGQGPQTQFPNGGGGNANNGGNYFSGHGSYFYGNGCSRENNSAQLVGQRPSHPLGSVPDRDDASVDPALLSRTLGKKASEISHLGPSSLSGHHQLLDSAMESSPHAMPPMDNSKHHGGRKPHNLRSPSETTSFNNKSPRQMTSFKGLSPKKSQERPSSEPQNLLRKKCKSCGHIMKNCVECKLQEGNVDRCHLCTGKASQQHGVSKVLEDYDQYYDFACNGMSDRNRSASKIAWALEQVSQAFKTEGDLCSTGISRTSTYSSFEESFQWVSVMKAPDTACAFQASEQSTFTIMGPGNSTKTLSGAWDAHATRCRYTRMTLALCSPQVYNKIGHSGSLKGIHIGLQKVLYDTQYIIGDTSIACQPGPEKKTASGLTAEHAISCLPKTPESLCTIQSKTMSFRGFTVYRASCVVKDRQSPQHPIHLIDAPSPAKVQLTRRRRARLRRKLQVIIGLLVLQASVTDTYPVSKQLEDKDAKILITESEDTDLIETGSDLDLSEPKILPQWLRETISTFSAGLIDHVESTMLATSIYKAEEEIWPKVKTFVGSMASYLETPVSPAVIEQHIAEYTKLGIW